MSEHVIQNPVPTAEQMANLLGVSPARVATLRDIMRADTKGMPSFPGGKPRKTVSHKADSTLSNPPLRQFKMRKKSSTGVKSAAR